MYRLESEVLRKLASMGWEAFNTDDGREYYYHEVGWLGNRRSEDCDERAQQCVKFMRARRWGSLKPRFAMLKGVSTIQGENMQVDVRGTGDRRRRGRRDRWRLPARARRRRPTPCPVLRRRDRR